MSVKSDRWIRRMAAEGMIEPFEAGQVRSVDGQKIVSYGTSSYGYDVRVAREFKIFTNINSTIVDPKNFDADSFVDFTGDVCIIPPNSFALARTVEFFRIPRNVLTICLGKCLTADTRIVDAESGAYLPITDFGWGRKTIALDGWRNAVARVAELIPQGRKPVYELRTKAGLRIRATANHPFRQLHGWTALGSLQPGDRIAVAREIPLFGSTPLPDWEAALLGLMISEGQCSTPGHSPTFTSADPVLVRLLEECVAKGELGCVSPRARFGYRVVNQRGRGGIVKRNRMTQWLSEYRLDVGALEKFVPQVVFTAPKESARIFLQALFSGDGSVFRHDESSFVEYYSGSRRLIEDVHHLLLRFGIFSLIREKRTAIGTDAYRVQIADRTAIARFAAEIGFWPDSIKQRRLEEDILPLLGGECGRSNFDALPREAWPMLRSAVAGAGITFASTGFQRTRPKQSMPLRMATALARATANSELLGLADGPLWDVVTSIEPVGEEEVYDLHIPRLQNFVANGIIVHNSTYARCGIIVNVTPLEPEWEGHVTLEFSNTTPLPAKIYANEGCAQVVFLESDEVCETSYRDRGGKYQGQTGVTLPKT
jgi:deoxycytidine triphosphate deaminase